VQEYPRGNVVSLTLPAQGEEPASLQQVNAG
jgi:hypothetical protein